MLADINVAIDGGAVQTFVEQQIGAGGDIFPGRESAGFLRVRRRLAFVVQVSAKLAGARGAVVAEQGLELPEQVRFRAKMAEMTIALFLRRLHRCAHRFAVVEMECVAFDHLRVHAFAAEDVDEAGHDRRRAGA